MSLGLDYVYNPVLWSAYLVESEETKVSPSLQFTMSMGKVLLAWRMESCKSVQTTQLQSFELK